MSTQKNCTWIFPVDSFIITKHWKQQRFPATDEWVNKFWYIHVVESHLAIKQTIGACNSMDESHNDYTEWKKLDKKWVHMVSCIYMKFKKVQANL